MITSVMFGVVGSSLIFYFVDTLPSMGRMMRKSLRVSNREILNSMRKNGAIFQRTPKT